MKKVSHSNRLLITGGGGFTGGYLINHFRSLGYEVFYLKSNLLDAVGIASEINECQPDYLIHLAAISYADFNSSADYYRVNVEGTVNVLEALKRNDKKLRKVVLASSAAVYGNQKESVLHEGLSPLPVSHYGASKLAMEHAGLLFAAYFPLLIVRPFNYTGVGHSENFLVPKIVSAYKKGASELALGNLNVAREFNDIRDVVRVYEHLLLNEHAVGFVNLCSGRIIRLLDIIEMLNGISGFEMRIFSDSKIVRNNDVEIVGGDPGKLTSLSGYAFEYPIAETLEWMFRA